MTSPEYLNDSEIRQLVGSIDSPRDRAIIVLILSTGIFMAELIALDIDSIDFTTNQLKLTGKRTRKVSLNDDALTALKAWLEARPRTPETALFVTERGIPKRLSERSIDHVIRSSGQAFLKQSIGYQLLRNTFIVRLLTKTNMDIKTAAKFLGVDRETLDRFKAILNPSDDPVDTSNEHNLNNLDTRSTLKKVLAKTFGENGETPSNEGIATSQSLLAMTGGDDRLIGRETTIKTIKESISHNHSVLITGPAGIGKTHLLKTLSKEIPGSLFIATPALKDMLIAIVKVISPSTEIKPRTNAKQLLEIILATDTLTPPILIIDQLDRLKISELDTLLVLIDGFPLIGATSETPTRLQSLWWKFDTKIALEPLNHDDSKKLIQTLTQNLSMNPSDYERLETKILNVANGNPLAISEMISQLPATQKVTSDAIHDIDHAAGITYRDWTGMMMVIWGLLVISRFIALGTHSFEGYILAGIGTSIFVVLKFFVRLNR